MLVEITIPAEARQLDDSVYDSGLPGAGWYQEVARFKHERLACSRPAADGCRDGNLSWHTSEIQLMRGPAELELEFTYDPPEGPSVGLGIQPQCDEAILDRSDGLVVDRSPDEVQVIWQAELTTGQTRTLSSAVFLPEYDLEPGTLCGRCPVAEIDAKPP